MGAAEDGRNRNLTNAGQPTARLTAFRACVGDQIAATLRAQPSSSTISQEPTNACCAVEADRSNATINRCRFAAAV